MVAPSAPAERGPVCLRVTDPPDPGRGREGRAGREAGSTEGSRLSEEDMNRTSPILVSDKLTLTTSSET